MKKNVVRFLMLLFVLAMSINVAWANFSTKPYYVAQLTASASSTGGGKVYLDAGQNGDNYEPQDEDFVDSDTRTKGLALSMQGMDRMRVAFTTWQKADDGYYFVGWSYADNGFDLGMRKPEDAEQDNFSDLYDVGTEKSTYETVDPEKEDSDPKKDANGNVIYVEDEYFPAVYTLYATFEPIRIAGFEIDGSNTITDGTFCTQTVTFELAGEDIDPDDFETLAITSSTGGGAWTNASGEALSISDLDISGETATVEVKFTAPNTNIAEYTANLRLTTQANITMNVLLGARIIAEGVEAIRYNKSKVQQETGNLTDLLSNAVTGDIIKLNGDYDAAVEINKNITFDLNGYELSNTLTVSGGDVTIAYSPYGGEADELEVTGGKAILNGGTFSALTIGTSGSVEQNGATITKDAENNGSLTTLDGYFQGGLTSAGTLNVNGGVFEGEIAINITGGSAQIKKGSIYGTLYGVQTNGGSTTIEKLAEVSGDTKALNGNGGTLTVNNGKFADPENLSAGSITFYAGYFQTNNSEEDEVLGKHVWRNTSGAEYREGYEFFVGSAESAKAAGVSVCHIGGTSYAALEDALAYANTTSDKVIIIMDNDYTMPAGYYTLPENAVLIVPKNNDQGNETKTVERAIYSEVEGHEVSYVAPTKFRCLTLSEGVNLDVHGTIEVSGTQYSSHEAFTSAVYGPYGQLQMNKGSKITLQDGSELRAWGYVTGDIAHQDAKHHVPMGEIDARRGSMVREQFQMGDWKGAAFSGMGLLQGNPVFPLNTYFIQNIEVPVKYHPGAVLSTAAGVTAAENEWGGYAQAVSGFLGTANISMSANDIKVIGVTEGDPAMFLMDAAADAENTWVRKWYDASKDQQVYEINSGAHIGNLIIPLVSSPFFSQFSLGGNEMPEDLTMNSGQYFLPITNNFKLHLLSGIMDFTQSTELLPGAEVEIDKESRVYITPTEGVNSGALFVYDAEDWGNYAGGVPARKVKYTPSFDDGENDGVPSTRGITMGDLEDATILVHGTFEIAEDGYVYTSEHGANIISKNEDAGTFAFFADNTEANVEVSQVSGEKGGSPDPKTFYPAKLRNKDNTFVETSGVENMQTLIYLNDKWIGDEQLLLYLDCYTAEADAQKYYQGEYEDAIEKIYIKPQEYVEIAYSSFTVTGDADALSLSVEGNPNHTFSDAAGAGRLFIQVGDNLTCQWWEVEAKDNYYHCIHPDNDTYYEWNESASQWEEVRFEITWLDWDGAPILDAEDNPVVYEVPYGTQAEWLSTNPTREPSLDYTYDFTGWSPALGKVTSDVTYMATYEEKQIKYTIVFVNDGGMEIERHLLARDEVPVCENAPTRTGYILQWSPNDPAPVTGDETYTATWLPEPPTTYTITFKNYDGMVLKKEDGTTDAIYTVEAGQDPAYDGAEPTKDATNEYEYTFSGWKPAIAPAISNATYVAQFVEEPRQYEVKFYQEDKTTLIETQSIPYGGMPVIPDYTKQNTAQYTYSIQWKNVDGDDNIQPVIEDVDYYAAVTTTTNKYNVKLISNPSGACVLVGNGIYEYDEAEDAVTISVTNIAANHTFTGWSDGQGGTNTTRQMAITGDINLVANFTVTDPDYDINWWNEDGSEKLVPTVGQKENTNTLYPGATPTKPATAQYTYTFNGWTTSPNGAGTYYKNNMTPKATAHADYYAHFEATVNNYEVTLTASPASAATFSGLGVYPYNESADAVTLTVIPNAGYTFTGWSDGQEGTNLVRKMAITDNIHLVANFTVNEPDYTITWKSEDGTQTLAEVGYKYKTPSTYTGETPTKAATAEYSYTFDGWTSEADGAGTYYANGATPKVMADATYFAHFAEVPVVPTEEDLEIGVGETEDLDHAVVERTNLVITSNGVNASGQLLGAENLTITGEAIFRLEQDFAAATWYAVAVPWTVDPATGIHNAAGVHLPTGNVYVIEFDASVYASADRESGRSDYWKFLDVTGNDMEPGKLYMVYLAAGTTALEFHKKAGASIWTTSTSVSTASGSVTLQENWNAIANPALYYADMTIADTYGDVLKYNGNDVYVVAGSTNMVVGQPIFAQVSTASTVDAEPVGGGAGMPAYRRVQQETTADNRFAVELTQNGNLADRMIVQTAEEKANEYVIGKDLAKMSVSTKVAQMWINRYDAKLCKNTIALQGEKVEYPLNIFAPAAGRYVLSASQERGDATLYLTHNGEAIWNLSEGDYVLMLENGTDANYGLRISAKAPQVATGVDEAVVDAKGETRKVLINNQVFIIRGEKVYTIDGQMVK